MQAKLFAGSGTGLQALTDAILCEFSRVRIRDVCRAFPELACDMTWLCAHEERMVDDALLSAGRRSAVDVECLRRLARCSDGAGKPRPPF